MDDERPPTPSPVESELAVYKERLQKRGTVNEPGQLLPIAYADEESMIPLKPARRAQLAEYAQWHGQELATALDDLLAAALDWEAREYREAVEGVREGYADFKAGRTRPANEFLDQMRQKYGLGPTTS